MESTQLLHPEHDENQNIEVNTGASLEDQLIDKKDEPTSVTTETVAEPEQKTSMKIVEEDESMNDMMSEIENSEKDIDNAEEETDDESEQIDENETIESIEGEYGNLSLDEAILELEKVVENPNYNAIKIRVGVLKSILTKQLKEYKKEQYHKFIDEGGEREEYAEELHPLESKFYKALSTFKINKNQFIEELEKQKEENLKAKQEIIEKLKELIEENSTLKEKNDKFNEYKELWHNIGAVPHNESHNLWQNYHFYLEKFYDLLRINKEFRELDLKKNLEAKIKLCETVEALLLEESITKSFKKLQQLHNEWKEIGPVMEDKKEQLWERFKNASDEINLNRRNFYEQIDIDQKNNYNAKVVLCEKAEELISQEINSIKEHNHVDTQLKDLLKMWKTLGSAPNKLNDEIWSRFKAVLDAYFQQRKQYFQQLHDVQMQNYNQKLDLTLQAEAIANRTDWRQATNDIIQLQKVWKGIGVVPRKHSDAIWKRFRAACDNFFEAKSTYFANIKDINAENLKKKQELIERIANYQFLDDKEENFQALKEFQRQWVEIGHVPRKLEESIYEKYREVINRRFAELKVNFKEDKNDRFKSKIDTILNDPNATKLLDKERRFLVSKMTTLKDEINLLENNLGFFARSKNAELLREEFTKKINLAKEEVKEIEHKIKMLEKQQK